MSALEWRSYGTGSEAWIGPIRCAVYKRGEWIADVSVVRRHVFRDAGRHPDETTARRAAEAHAAAWLREEIASLTSALATLEAPPHSTPQTPPT